MTDSSTVRDTDRRILRALQLAPRAPFAAIAEVLGISEQTVARRYRSLRDHGLVRVSGVVRTEAIGQTQWMVRIRCKPRAADSLARALAQRTDVGWVYVYGGSVEVGCSLRARSEESRDDLLVDRLPRSESVLDVTAAMVLHTFTGGDAGPTGAQGLSQDQEERLRRLGSLNTGPEPAHGSEPWSTDAAPVELDDSDWALLGLLAQDGRAGFAELGERAGLSAAQARRRLHRLVRAGVVYFDVDVAPSVEARVGAHLWLTVAPGAIPECGARLAQLAPTTYVAAVTGTHNLVAAVECASTRELYTVTTDGLATVPGVVGVEVAPQLRTVKQAGPVLVG